jgi:hypothetical protein
MMHRHRERERIKTTRQKAMKESNKELEGGQEIM